MIHTALVDYLVAKQALERKAHKELFVSDLGQHPYKAMSRVMGVAREPFDEDTLVKMQGGNVMEADTLQALQWAYGKVAVSFPLHNGIWSGYADAVMGHGTTTPIIIEHKATGDQWFDYKGSLPRSSHACQVWMYQQLYNEAFGVYPRAILYYRAWGFWAEFEISENADGTLMATGQVKSGKGAAATVARKIDCLPHLLRGELEAFFADGDMPDPYGELDPESWTYAEDHYVAWKRENAAAANGGTNG